MIMKINGKNSRCLEIKSLNKKMKFYSKQKNF